MASIAAPQSLRRHDLDDLKVFLTSLVSVHHTALTYGGFGHTTFQSLLLPRDATVGVVANAALSAFNAYNQSFFMGLFFYVSGRMSAQAIRKMDNKPDGSRWEFFKRKAWRLGVPAVVYTLVVHPLDLLIGMQKWRGQDVPRLLVNHFKNLKGFSGPLWYNATLLVFDAIASLLPRSVVQRSPTGTHALAQCRTWSWAVVGLLSFLVRTKFPIGTHVPVILLQPPHMMQYFFAYTTGYLDLLSETPTPPGSIPPPPGFGFHGFSLASAFLLSAVGLFSLLLPMTNAQGNLTSGLHDLVGGWNPLAFAHAMWDQYSFALIGPALITYFGRRATTTDGTSDTRPRYAYAAFLVHNIVATSIETAFESALIAMGFGESAFVRTATWKTWGPIAMSVVLGALNVKGTWAAARGLLEIVPALKNLL